MQRLLASPLFIQFMRFAFVGLFGTGVQYICLWIGVEFLHTQAALASAVGYALGTVLNYWLNYFFTFKSSKSHTEAAAKYYAVVGVGWCINGVLMTLFVNHLNWYYWPAQILTTSIGLVWNFGGSRFWAFRHKEVAGAQHP